MAVDTAARGGPTAIGTSETTIYTVPGATTAVLRTIHIVNTTVAAITVKASIGADAAATRLLSDLSLPANGTYDWSGFIPMVAAETVRSQASATGCTMTIGVVQTA